MEGGRGGQGGLRLGVSLTLDSSYRVPLVAPRAVVLGIILGPRPSTPSRGRRRACPRGWPPGVRHRRRGAATNATLAPTLAIHRYNALRILSPVPRDTRPPFA